MPDASERSVADTANAPAVLGVLLIPAKQERFLSQERVLQVEMSLVMVQDLIARAIEQARNEFKRPICIAICDRHGLLLSFMRMPGATIRSITIAQGKAYTAARMGMNTDAFLARLHRENMSTSDFCDPMFTGLPGGCVLKNSAGEIIGAAGISGLTAQEDQVVANMMAATTQMSDIHVRQEGLPPFSEQSTA